MLKKTILVSLFLSFSSVAMADAISDFKQRIIGMTDQQVWDEAIAGRVGTCKIFDARNCSACACDYYAQTKPGADGYNGLPGRNNVPYGTGCMVSPGNTNCWGSPNTYQTYSGQICTGSYITNGANMIRIALQNSQADLCNIGTYLASLTPPAGAVMSDLLSSGDIDWPINKITRVRNPANCYVKVGKEISVTTTGGVVKSRAAVKQSAKSCRLLARRLMKAFNKPNHFTETVGASPLVEALDLAVNLGSLSPVSFNQAIADAHLAANINFISAFDTMAATLQSVPVSATNQATINSLTSSLNSISVKATLVSDEAIAAELGNVIYGSAITAPSDTILTVKPALPSAYDTLVNQADVLIRQPASSTSTSISPTSSTTAVRDTSTSGSSQTLVPLQ